MIDCCSIATDYNQCIESFFVTSFLIFRHGATLELPLYDVTSHLIQLGIRGVEVQQRSVSGVRGCKFSHNWTPYIVPCILS